MSEEQPGYPPIPHPGHCFVDDVGYGFVWGLAGGSIFRFFGGLRRGGLAGAARAVVSGAGAPRAAGTMAAYFALCSVSEATMNLARPNKDDLWNALAAAGVSWAALGARRGAPGAAFAGARLLLTFLDGNVDLHPPREQPPLPLNAPTTPAVNGFLGIPLGPPIVVEEVSVGDKVM